MAVPSSVPGAASVVAALVGEIETELDPLVARTGNRIREEIPEFRRLPVDALARAIRGNVVRALSALRELRPPTDGELEQAAEIGRERAEQGLTVDAVLHAYRISVSSVWARFGELARERGADVGSVLAFSETLWLWADAVMDIVAAAHRDVELEQAREEQQRRDAFVLALLSGTLSAAELRRESATQGLDADRAYVPFRARSPQHSHRVAVALAGDGGLVIALDRDLAGIAARSPDGMPGLSCGLGPPARLPEVAASFALASRALQTAVAFGQEGAFSLADLSIRPAILADEPLGEAFAARYLDPLDALGRMGAELSATLRAWFDQEMRIEDTARVLHLHPNTLRHRLRRFEAATGATLRDPRHLIELWWALEHRRLAEG
jgi:DNA-binding PucR family transcriptional regulator